MQWFWGFTVGTFAFTSPRAALDDVVDYTNYAVVTAGPVDSYGLTALKQIEAKYTDELQLDFWNHPSNFTETVSICLPKENVAFLLVLFSSVGVPYVISIPNLQEIIDKEKEEIGSPNFSSERQWTDFDIGNYHPLDEIVDYIKKVTEEYSDLVKLQVIGESVENREIIGLKIGLNSNEEKPIFYIDAGIHAREWIAPAVALYVINDLVTNSNEPSIQELLTEFDFFIFPVLNPDGYVWSWTKDRMWRKNRATDYAPPPDDDNPSDCNGVDLNRNFPLGFGGASTSSWPCSNLYTGPRPFSEPESRAVKNFTEDNKSRFKIAITFHSYGQQWLFPWAYITNKSGDYDTMLAAAEVAVEALEAVYGTNYVYGKSTDVVSPMGGCSDDWQYLITKTPYVYRIELRPRSYWNSFLLPKEEIIPSGNETWAGLKAMAKFILD